MKKIFYCGIDVGVVSVKLAILTPSSGAPKSLNGDGSRLSFTFLNTTDHLPFQVMVAQPRRTRGKPLNVVREFLTDLQNHFGPDCEFQLAVTGMGSMRVSEILKCPRLNEFQSATRAMNSLYPEVRTIFEIGGESSRYIRLEPDPVSKRLGIIDCSSNGDCAAGTGAFLDQQAHRLKIAVEEITPLVQQAERAAQIAGRCSVFAKSDMVHAQQKGYSPAEVLKGLCHAVAMNFKSAVVKGRQPQVPIAVMGGVSVNQAVVAELRDVFCFSGSELFVPEASQSIGAIGAAISAIDSASPDVISKIDKNACKLPSNVVFHADLTTPDTGKTTKIVAYIERLDRALGAVSDDFSTSPPLAMERVKLLRDLVEPYVFLNDTSTVDAYLGIDVGSVGTKLVLIDKQGEVIHSIFTRTMGRPIEVVTRCLLEMQEAVGERVQVLGVGTTGSGRELIGELVGADSINDEITAHKTGATFIGDRMLGRRPDTIFEIGGQDSKYISLQPEGGPSRETIVVDFTMNEACAAGTGSFLEEQAEELGVSIKDEFSRLALSSKAPLKLGERCTVFMERDVNTCLQRGARREDIIAGLAYSVATNYINRVVRGRPIGSCVFFQGGTAYNDAVAAAFSILCDREIIVPPHNAVLGAIGAALLAREKITRSESTTRFRGFDIRRLDYTMREFVCKGCSNHCQIQEFTVEGEKTFWGDKCSDRYRKQAKTDRKPVIPDLLALREELLDADEGPALVNPKGRIGIPQAMYMIDQLPLWRRFFWECGFEVVRSGETHRGIIRQGLDAVVAEPCFPIIVAHGHVAELIRQNVDFIWMPNILSSETKIMDRESYVCPWGQTLPFVIRQSPKFRSWSGRILCPTLRFRDGTVAIFRALMDVAGQLGVSRRAANRAWKCAQEAHQRFREEYLAAGRRALEVLEQTGESGMVLVGRPYNIHDSGMNLSVGVKIRERYGVNVIPIDALPVDETDVKDVNSNMYWDYGRRILAAAKLVARHPRLHIIYITNFKCGPDSFIKGFVRWASGKPFLTLQFDGHSNDAGMMTRCEAYLDSKGILRWWRRSNIERPEEALPVELSTSRKWPMQVLD